MLADREILIYSNRGLYEYSELELLNRKFVVGSAAGVPCKGFKPTEVFLNYFVVVSDINVLEGSVEVLNYRSKTHRQVHAWL